VTGLLAGAVLGCGSLADAQIGYLWTYEELLLKADLVVIGECRTTVDTGNHVNHPGLTPAFPVVEMRTAFAVEAIMKSAEGNAVAVGGALRVKHYRHDMDRWRKEHPAPPGLPPPGVVNTGSSLLLEEKRSYLLFLTKSADALYEPLSGHTFPTDSVYRLDRRPVGR